MRNKVVTMTDSNYFQYGKRLLETRHIVEGADFVCYGPPGLLDNQRDTLDYHNIEFKEINKDIWDTWMQSLKFRFIMNELERDCNVTFVDWDTYFIKDWGHVFEDYYALGITVRNEFIDGNKMYRAWANGGVIFANCFNYNATIGMCDDALKTIESGESRMLPEYDKIWRTLEEGRRPEKTHYRTDKRWWCDQIYLSALVMQDLFMPAREGYRLNIKQFDCRQYNNMWEETPDTYIMHLKDKSGAPGSLKDGK